jgi:hypothetical protein
VSESENELLDINTDISPSCNLKLDDKKINDIGTQISSELKRYLIVYILIIS